MPEEQREYEVPEHASEQPEEGKKQQRRDVRMRRGPYGSDSFDAPPVPAFPKADRRQTAATGAAKVLHDAAVDIVRALPIGVYAADARGMVIDANPAFLSLLSVSTIHDLKDKRLAEFVEEGPTRNHALPGDGRLVLRDTAGAQRRVVHTRLGGGKDRHAEISYGVVMVEVAAGDLLTGEGLDAELLHTQKLASLGVLAGGIAHDVNNLLVAIIGHAKLSMMQVPSYVETHNQLQRIEHAALRAAQLTNQLLDYAGKSKPTLGEVDLSKLVEEMARLLEISIAKGVALKYELGEGVPIFRGDGNKLRQVVMNLITNASDAIGDRFGVITVRTGTETVPPSSREQAPGVYVFLEVSDTGHGMDDDTKSRIFDPFFTTKKGGRGLGLAAVLGIVHEHGGIMKVDSSVGTGTTFRMLLPVHEDDGWSLPATGGVVVGLE